MNYAASFDVLQDQSGSPSGSAITVPDADLLFTGNYARAGSDLVLSKDGHQHVLHDYFKGTVRSALASPDGAQLSGDLVTALTGEIQLAQAGGAPEPAKVIGQVSKLTGSATAIRNGVSIELNVGDNVNKGDVIQAGANSSIGLTFIDGTVFGLSANARMVLNEMVYDPQGSSNSSLLSLIQGTISFVAGETAKQGDMRVTTPVATMGIRGTAVLVEIDFTVPGQGDAPPVRFHVLAEPGNTTGSYVLYSNTTGQTLGTVNTAGLMTSVTGAGDLTTGPAPPLSPMALNIIQQTLQLYFPNYNPNPPPRGSSGDGLNQQGLPGDGSSTTPQMVPDNPYLSPIKYELPGDGVNAPNIIVTIGSSSATIANSPPLVSIINVINESNFTLGNYVVINDPDSSNPRFNDVAVPYVAGSGHLSNFALTSGPPPGVDPGSLISINPETGAVTYDAAAFRFLGANDQAVYTLGFDSTSGPDTVHNVITVTITGANDTPVLAPGAVEGGLVVAPGTGSGGGGGGPGIPTPAPGLIGGFGGVAGYGALALPAEDDNSSEAIDVTSVFGAAGLNFFGNHYTSIYINNNGNITFGGPDGNYTPEPINANFRPMIAAFWADVDTRGTGAVYYHLDPAAGTVTVTWDRVGYFDEQTDKVNSFQIQLISTGNGNFNILFRYGDIQWTTGDASEGSGGLGGIPARIGYSAGDGVHFFEMPQSGNQAALLTLENDAGNTGTVGVSGFQVVNGEIQQDVLSTSGTVGFTDVDLSDVHTAHVQYTGNELGTLTLVKTQDTTGTGTGGTLTWTYQVDGAKARAAMAADPDRTIVDSFQVVIDDGHGGTVTQTVNVTLAGGSAPTIDTSHLTGQFLDSAHTQHSVIGLHVADPDSPNELYTISLANQHGVLTKLDGSALPTSPMSLSAINAMLDAGLRYTFANGVDVENVKLTITDQHGASDEVNFVFRFGYGSSQSPLVGTPDRDVIFSSTQSETLTGDAGADQFVFAANSGRDVITDFTPGQDHIDLQMPAPFAPNEPAFSTWLANHATASGADTLLTLKEGYSYTSTTTTYPYGPSYPVHTPTTITVDPDTVLLKNVSLASLHVGDFIVH